MGHKVSKVFKSIGKAVANVVTLGYVGQREQAKALQRQTDAETEAAQLQADAAKEAAANTPEDQTDAESTAIREDEANKIKRRRGMAGTIKTSALGTTGTVATGSNKLGVTG